MINEKSCLNRRENLGFRQLFIYQESSTLRIDIPGK